MNTKKPFDFLIAGAGFAGSITAMALANSGFRVCLVEKGKHPRFAIGESSTPVADMILRDLANRYHLPFLNNLSRYGTWQKHYPDVVCGLKRGFSYFHHQKGENFTTDRKHSNELFVAASENDENSDTHWLRSDVDHFLVQQVEKSTVHYFDNTEVLRVARSGDSGVWTIELAGISIQTRLKSRWILDATGSSAFSEKMFGTTAEASDFETDSMAFYSHFEGTEPWQSLLESKGFPANDYPFHPDHAALHHLIDEGWVWMLRFNNSRLSAGIVMDRNSMDGRDGSNPSHGNGLSDELAFQTILKNYPSLWGIFEGSELAESPGRMIRTGRLQRKLNRTFGHGWVALPHTAGFVDPLHSTGIAHTLTGVEKLLNLLTTTEAPSEIDEQLQQIEDQFYRELKCIDLLVSACYKARFHMGLFHAVVMLYFVMTICYEQKRLKGELPGHFLCAGDAYLWNLLVDIHEKIRDISQQGASEAEIETLIQTIRSRITPWNHAGLMEPGAKNMYRHTAIMI